MNQNVDDGKMDEESRGMSMIRYPKLLQKGNTIGVTATSSGVGSELHHLLRKAAHQFERRGYQIHLGETVWTDDKLTSAPKEIRSAELMEMLMDDEICAILPPWGGEFYRKFFRFFNLIRWNRNGLLGIRIAVRCYYRLR